MGLRVRRVALVAAVAVLPAAVLLAGVATPGAAAGTHLVVEPAFGPPTTMAPVAWAVECPSISMCTALSVASDVVVARTWSSGSWGPSQTVMSPGPKQVNAEVDALSCPSSGNCVAIVVAGLSGGADATDVIAQESGVWGAPHTLLPPSTITGSYYADWVLACASAGTCTAIGSFSTTSFGTFAFGTATSSSAAWSATTTLAEPGVPQNDLSPIALSCSTAHDCTVLFDAAYYDSHGLPQEYSQSEVAGVWAAPTATPGPDWNFEGLDCWASGSCIAVGAQAPPGAVDQSAAYALIENGTWEYSIAIAPPTLTPATSLAELDGVSCWAPGSCVAVGKFYATVGERSFPAAVTFNADVPSSVALDRVSPSVSYPGFATVSCPSASACFAFRRSQGSGAALTPINPSPPPTRPGPPVGLVAHADGGSGGGNVRLTWGPPIIDGGLPVTGFVAYVLATHKVCRTIATTCTFNYLPGQRRYRAEVYARTAAGRSVPRSAVFVIG